MIDRKRILLSLAVIGVTLCTCPVVLRAGGTTTYDFLRSDVSARAAALGGSFVTMIDDPNSIFYNPAGLASLTGNRVSFGFFKHLMDINSGYASYGTEIPKLGFVGFGAVYINYGQFQQTGEEGQNLGTFGAGEFALSAGYAGELESGFNYGVNAKFIYSSIANYNSSGAAVDFGLLYSAVPQRLILGASLLNLGTQFNPYINTREDLPLDLKIGASIYPEHLPAVILVSFDGLNEQQNNFGNRLKAFAVGVEFTASPNVQLRFGYNNENRQDLTIGQSAGFAGLSLGIGFTNNTYNIDYGYTSYGKIGDLHRVSIALSL
jgi:long-subunit fatty acid transport protein